MATGNGQIKRAIKDREADSTFNKMTLGEVVDTNDPQQMGRLRVVCPSLGDSMDTPIKDIPWATYITPFGGISDTGSRGRKDHDTTGPVAYGMWNVPKVGSTVLVTCVDGDTRFRLWLGCVVGQFLPHTMPHGRFDYDAASDQPAGPLSSTEDPIEPLYSELTLAFTQSKDSVTAGLAQKARSSFEFRTRGADYSVAALTNELVESTESSVSSTADNRNKSVTEEDGNVLDVTQGYGESRVEPPLSFAATDNKNYDPQTYNWTTPGFHSISMDDRTENCRIRIRTTHGHQIIMDDTNERMYISTPQGDTWIELDEKGNIDIYGKRNVSIHAEKDINMTTDKTFRVKAKEGIHLISEDEVRIHSKGGNGLNMKSDKEMHIESIQDMHVKTSQVLYLASSSDTNFNISGIGKITTGSTLNLLSGANTYMTAGPDIHLNGPPSVAAQPAVISKESFWTDRVPEHEPWSRIMTKASVTDKDLGNTHTGSAEYTYKDTEVGRKERGDDLGRNPKWHR